MVVDIELMQPENTRDFFNEYKDFTFSMIDKDLADLEKQIDQTESVTPADLDKEQLRRDLAVLFDLVDDLERAAGYNNMWEKCYLR